MARQPYKSTESIQMMTTRQLRQYISDKATEAQARLDSMNVDKAPAALKAYLPTMTYKNGTKIKRSTSNMSREAMVEYALDLRAFNALDTSSKFARDTEYQNNKGRYESFVRNQIDNNKDSYWNKYINKDGSVSKRGFTEYKKYVQFLKSIKDIQEAYGYRTIKEYGQKSYVDERSGKVVENDMNRRRFIMDKLNELYTESQGKGWTQSELIDKFYLELDHYDQLQRGKKAARVISKVKVEPNKSKSSTNIKVKKTGKMKTDGSIRERLT